jgi:hypothetical protein
MWHFLFLAFQGQTWSCHPISGVFGLPAVRGCPRAIGGRMLALNSANIWSSLSRGQRNG